MILWSCAPRDVDLWLEYCEREDLFREVQLAKAGVGQPTPEEEYCSACRQLGEDDCENCSREISVRDL